MFLSLLIQLTGSWLELSNLLRFQIKCFRNLFFAHEIRVCGFQGSVLESFNAILKLPLEILKRNPLTLRKYEILSAARDWREVSSRRRFFTEREKCFVASWLSHDSRKLKRWSMNWTLMMCTIQLSLITKTLKVRQAKLSERKWSWSNHFIIINGLTIGISCLVNITLRWRASLWAIRFDSSKNNSRLTFN